MVTYYILRDGYYTWFHCGSGCSFCGCFFFLSLNAVPRERGRGRGSGNYRVQNKSEVFFFLPFFVFTLRPATDENRLGQTKEKVARLRPLDFCLVVAPRSIKTTWGFFSFDPTC